MPFRQWFAKRGAKHPVAYSNALLAGGVLVSMTIAVVISIQASNRAIQQSIARERAATAKAEAMEQQRRAEGRQTVCTVIREMIKVYTDPATQTGRDAAVAWRGLASTYHCT
jgi:hypothetical protein